MENFGNLCLFVFIALQLLDEHFYIYKLYSLELKAMYDLYDEMDEEEILLEENEIENMWPLPSEIMFSAPVKSQHVTNEVMSPINSPEQGETDYTIAPPTPEFNFEVVNTAFQPVVLEQDTEDFISNLIADIEPITVEQEQEQVQESVADNLIILDEIKETLVEETSKGAKNMESTILSLENWNEETPSFNLFSYHEYHIKDNTQGLQNWFCEIVGKNEKFIHVLDLTNKIWLDISHLEETEIHLNEVIKLTVERTGEDVTVLAMQYIDLEDDSQLPEDLDFESIYATEEKNLEYILEEHELKMKTAD